MSRESELPNLRHLQVFCAVARAQSLNAATGELPLSQPAMTQAIARLERYFGAALFKRRSSGMQLTTTGVQCLARVERALAQLAGATEIDVSARVRGQQLWPAAALSAAQLHALMAIVEHGGFSAAARGIGRSRPTLHRAARQAEMALGVALFENTSFGIRPTRTAQLMARGAALALHELQQARAESSLVPSAGTTVIGAMPLARSRLLPAALRDFTTQAPEHRVRVLEGTYAALLAGLRSGEIDWLIGALRGRAAPSDVVEHPLFDDPLAIIMRAEHPLARLRRCTVRQLIRFPWIAPLPGSPLRAHFEALFEAADLPVPAASIECNSLMTARALLVESDYLMLLSAQQIYYERRARLLVARPHPRGAVVRRIGLTQRGDWRPTAAQTRLLDIVRHQAQRLTAAEQPTCE